MIRLVLLSLCTGIVAAAADAQVVLQQPVVGVTGVQTTVSVPDGGSAFLGGVSRARDSRATYGFAPFGSSLGREVNRSRMDVRVTIHDFEAMDQWLLAQPRTGDYQFRQRSTDNAWAIRVEQILAFKRGSPPPIVRPSARFPSNREFPPVRSRPLV